MNVGLEALKWGLGLVAVLSVGAVGGCGSTSAKGGGSGGGDSGEPYVPSYGGSMTAPTCESGERCECANGLYGTTTCDGTVAECDCAACALPATTTPSFEACGGEPFGAWRVKSTEAVVDFAPMAEGCAVRATEKAPLRLLLDLQDGGEARFVADGSIYEATVRSGCVERDGKTCESYGYTKDDCGRCVAQLGVLESHPDDARWKRVDSLLVVEAPLGGVLASFHYCVTGDELALRPYDSETVLKLERVSLVGRPLPCSERSAATCAPTNEQAECYVGVCTGAGQSCGGALTEGECNTKQGCTWDEAQCGGTPYPYCRISDYGVLPGCDATTQTPTCVGKSLACSDFPEDLCPTAGGCTKGNACTGEAAECTGFWDICTPGCTCEDVPNGDFCECTGTSKCSTATTEDACFADTYECNWEPACIGTLPDCSTLQVDQCQQVPGCQLAAP